MSNIARLPVQPSEYIADQLRTVADQIERGEFGEALSVTWVGDFGDGHIEVGFCGTSPLPAGAAHLSLALGMRKLEDI